MTDNELNYNHYKALLEDELKTLKEELQSLGRKNPNNPKDWEATPEADPINHPADPNVEADQIEEYEERTAILKQLEIRWNEIKSALTRIENNTYGMCEIDGKEIETERLQANPAARTCIAHMNESAK